MRNHIAVARGAGMVVVRVVGTGNMVTAVALNDFAEEERAEGYRRFVFDLAQCRGMDSTFMGCMVGLCTALQRPTGPGSSDAELPALPVAGPLGPPEPEPESVDDLRPLSRAEALEALQSQFTRGRSESPAARDGFVIAVNVSPECRELLNILGVDKFVRVHGAVDLSGLEVAELPERGMPAEERRRLILRAHEHLVEIDKRNEAQFGAFLKTLSSELSKGQPGQP